MEAALRVLRPRGSAGGQRVLVTAGPTLEDIDPVRFIGNRSSGRMGYAIAAEAARRGARVTLVSGPTKIDGAARRRDVSRCGAPRRCTRPCWLARRGMDVVVMAAAVADYTIARARCAEDCQAATGRWCSR